MHAIEIKGKKSGLLRDCQVRKCEEARAFIRKEHPGAEGRRLLAFADIVLDSFTDFHFIREVGPHDLYLLILSYYKFFRMERKPLDGGGFEDLPPTGIRIFNPSQDPELKGLVKHLDLESTVIQIHTQDAPFIFESIWKYLKKRCLHIFNAVHPVIPVQRKGGKIAAISEDGEKSGREVFLNIFIEKIVNPKNRETLEFEIISVLKALFLAVNDFGKMLELVRNLAGERKSRKTGEMRETLKREAEFLEWLADNFIFMGIQTYRMKKSGKKKIFVRDTASRLGVFRDPDLMDVVFPGQAAELEAGITPPGVRKQTVCFKFFNTCSSVIYHFDPIDAIDVDGLNAKGEVVSRTVLFGRFARGSIFQKSSGVPILAEKIGVLLEQARHKRSFHYRRELRTIFNQVSKRELFYLDVSELSTLMQLVLSVQSDEKVEIFVKPDPLHGYCSLFLIVSRSKYSREVREKIKDLLLKKYNRPITRWEAFDCYSNFVIVFYLDTRKGGKIVLDVDDLETAVQNIIWTWEDKLIRRLVHEHGDRSAFGFYNRYKNAFSALYREITDTENAVYDIRNLSGLEKNREIRINIFPADPGEVEIKLYSFEEIDLMTMIPTARNLGLNVTSEQVIPLRLHSGDTAYIHIFKVSGDEAALKNLLERRALLSETLLKIMSGYTVNDSLNHLVLKVGFHWRTVALFRTIKNYLLQIDKTFSPQSLDDVLLKFPDITANLFSFFEAKFKPGKHEDAHGTRERPLKRKEERFLNSLAQVTSLMEDQIFRGLFDVVKNMLRTNFYKYSDANYFSFKIDCPGIAKMPSPRPRFEIYVHSPELEGVHLRGGVVARGGLRWSDRYDDFRTEVLGLMKTQMLKNSVIVPVGSKGGFVLNKRDFKGPKERDAYVKRQYQTFIRGLLDITDNIEAGKKVFPSGVKAYDDHDPYLVVAADKGTARLSDAANEISQAYHFWLGDAFASGGAVGYDHKKEGITARGAWECVKRHFRERGVDIQKKSIRVAGIGDMSGDVFGNGMLLSRRLKLVAAFNHAHIFLDPDPDPEKSWKERKRLFDHPKLTWMDYSGALISKGGGVYSRSSKSISLAPEIRRMLGATKEVMNGEELIRSILTMEADLLWNGGIGTYVKASRESHLDVGDRANDRVRVNAGDLRVKVIGEGGNLGMTQLGRLEAAAKGIVCNTDAIDNSAGVDMSDHEVNLKILLDALLESGELKTRQERNDLLVRVTDEVADHVLRDNYLQSAVISMDRVRCAKRIEPFLELLDRLAEQKIMNKEDEFIPPRERLLEEKEAQGGVPRPLLAIPLGYAKIYVYQRILDSPLVDAVFAGRYLEGYFPEIFHRDFAPYLKTHRLKKEIISTVITNKIVNQAGVTFFSQVRERTGMEVWEIARAYIIVENLLDADDFRERVYQLDNVVPTEVQYKMLMDQENVIFQLCEWMLANLPEDRVSFDLINQYQEIIANFKKNLVGSLETVCSLEKGCLDKEVAELARRRIPKDLAETCVVLPYLKDTMAILKIKEELHYNFIATGNLYIKVNNDLCLDWIEEGLDAVDPGDEWEEKAVENLYDELKDYQNRIVIRILNFKRHEESIDNAFYNFMKEKEKVDRAFKDRVARIREAGSLNLVTFSVLIRSLKGFL